MIEKPIKINGMELSGRIILPPMMTSASEDGDVTEEICQYYAERAKNNEIALMITEHCYISEGGKANLRQLSIAEDNVIDGLKKLTDSIHCVNEKVRIFAQLSHSGANTAIRQKGWLPAAPSNQGYGYHLARELSVKEILEIEDAFAAAALRAVKSGYDGVEIHSAHGYLLNEFYSPLTNFREDQYGADTIENRLRIHTEIIQKIRKAVGNDYPIAVRLGACDYIEGGSTIKDGADAAKILEECGADVIDVSGGLCGFVVKGRTQPGYFGDASFQIKSRVKIPVILTGGVKTKKEADTLLENGVADLIGIGRALMKNPLLQ